MYILVGDRDYLLDIALKARDWFLGCGSEVVFDKMPGGRHRGTGKSLLKGKANTILDWFSARPNTCLSRNVQKLHAHDEGSRRALRSVKRLPSVDNLPSVLR
ncbi:MAG: hypothetical protein H0T89_20270 [Deltaproteobacteria bacterium]|nr:hypothetical protein [Deltaproteobacteria bacterium]